MIMTEVAIATTMTPMTTRPKRQEARARAAGTRAPRPISPSKGGQSTQITMLSHGVVDQVNQGNRREQVERLEAVLFMPPIS